MSMPSFDEAAAGVCSLARLCHARGWAPATSGNFSVVVAATPLRLAITPSGVDKGGLEPGEILEVDASGRVQRGAGTQRHDGGESSHARVQARFRLWFFNGRSRMRLPVAAKIAFSTAGAATAMVGSPTPPQKPPDGITIDSTLGICAICSTG